MLTQPISPTDAALANYERFTSPQRTIQKRMYWLYLTSLNYLPSQIAHLLDVHRNTVRNCHYYPCAQAFEEAILAYLNQLHTRANRQRLKTLLAPNFQMFKVHKT